jgi:hypothetical protein
MNQLHKPERDPRPAAVTFVTTEHFGLQGARAATTAESTGRASMFLAAVSGGLVALGLVATASSVGTAFYAFGLVLLPTLTFVGLVTFERVIVISEHSLAATLITGTAVTSSAGFVLARTHQSVWRRDSTTPLTEEGEDK